MFSSKTEGSGILNGFGKLLLIVAEVKNFQSFDLWICRLGNNSTVHCDDRSVT